MPLDAHFAARGAPPGSMRWHALLYAPAAARDRFAAAFALDAELREIACGTLDHGVAHAKLGWWREEATRLGQGGPRHPLTRVLLGASGSPGPLAAKLHQALGATEIELAQLALADEAEFAQYLAGAGTAIAGLALDPAQGGEDAAARFAAGCGRTIRLVEIVRDLPRDARRGRVFAPWTWLEDAGLELEELRAGEPSGKTQALLRRVAGLARESWREARDAASGDMPGEWRPLYVLAGLHVELLGRIERLEFAVGSGPVELPPLTRLFTAWRAARRA
jgi:phytoene synthase